MVDLAGHGVLPMEDPVLTGGKIELTRFFGSGLAGNILFRGSFYLLS